MRTLSNLFQLTTFGWVLVALALAAAVSLATTPLVKSLSVRWVRWTCPRITGVCTAAPFPAWGDWPSSLALSLPYC